MALRFNMLLEDAGIDRAQVRLLRHQPFVADRALLDIWRSERALFERYQAVQPYAGRARFSSAYWASFLGTWDGRTIFAGLYEVDSPTLLDDALTMPLTGEISAGGTIDLYQTRSSPLLERYEGRLFIDWGGGTSGKRAWVQRADNQDKRITELHLEAAEARFPGLMDFTTSLRALDAAPPAWIEPLAAARCVYLRTCPRTGEHHVGSATSEGGFWQRWHEYRANGHGGNQALLGRAPSDFQVAVLQVAGSADTLDTILAMEDRWKRKLGTREVGLNRN